MSKSKLILPGLLISLLLSANPVLAADYTVKDGDSLWKISQKNNISIDKLKAINGLSNDLLSVGQVLRIDGTPETKQASTAKQQPMPQTTKTNQTGWLPTNTSLESQEKQPNTVASYRPNNTLYTVKPGDTLGAIAQKNGISLEDLRGLNNLKGDLIYAGQTLVLKGSVSRGGDVHRSDSIDENSSVRYGQLVDWFTEGINILKPNKVFTVTDTATGKIIKLQVLGGSNHCDVEPLTKEDTETMLSLFTAWTWTPRPVCIHIDGRDIAASLSGMPHTTIENIKDNNVTGHYDMYLLNSKPHGSGVSQSYVQQHYDALERAAKVD
ncbi:Peptidoglycan-binding LysM [Desulforamulus reducens MI-1]|uniref:Peptidoglycan-binding LysM n=1 Tax=Desulforamulus reducens (strain ATCC BAA-1160 / DSM 100696 / MI-1) TaxID=349161 RepID=A4J4E0_DESRM|nr:LysM peptidoglycan-binding domain-containing protein [Desulforamulus reducens]ABO49943.1 Peptidoglycan-binding LysM [Desulforamulus reducens MI-1]